MAAISSILAAVAIASTVASVAQGVESRKSAKAAKRQGEQAQTETRAQQAQEAANARRQQIRQERVRRARILQSGENTGTSGSSGEFGSLGSLSTTLGSNLGIQQGAIDSAERQSIFLQNAADLNFESQMQQGRSQTYGQIASLAANGSNIFAPTPAPKAPVSTPVTDYSQGMGSGYGPK